MPSRQNTATFRQIRTLFDLGAIGGLTDRQLLERFEQGGGEGAELAFRALVERHGPMVLRVCRSVLGDADDADDAFQATFLVLVRRAGSLWVHDSLGPWLHQVAHRTAVGLRSAAARRRRHEEAALVRSSRATGAGVEAQELGAVLHEEVGRLPDRYRAVIVLCLLEGLTHAQAARRLGWPAGTVQSRLARGKTLLRDRLTRRGVAPCALGFGGRASIDAAVATPPSALVGATIRTATLFSLDREAIPAAITGLAKQVVHAMLILKLKAALRPLLLAALVLGAGVYTALRASGQAPPAAKDASGAVDPQAPASGLDAGRSPLVAPRELEARAGRGTLLLYALDKDGKRVIDPRGKGIFKEATMDADWVVITGVLDHRAVRDRLGRDREEKSIEVHPHYRRAEVERQERAPGANWSAWSNVDREKNCLLLSNLPEEAQERTPEDVRLGALVDPLPFLRAGAWEGVDVERLIKRTELATRAQGSIRRGTRPPFATSDSPEIMVRSLDFTVMPGFHYRYRVRIVIDGSDGLGQRREIFGPWSEPTAEVAVPE
jgi:RNA polymerase sigma factor (sigma-70 family)